MTIVLSLKGILNNNISSEYVLADQIKTQAGFYDIEEKDNGFYAGISLKVYELQGGYPALFPKSIFPWITMKTTPQLIMHIESKKKYKIADDIQRKKYLCFLKQEAKSKGINLRDELLTSVFSKLEKQVQKHLL